MSRWHAAVIVVLVIMGFQHGSFAQTRGGAATRRPTAVRAVPSVPSVPLVSPAGRREGLPPGVTSTLRFIPPPVGRVRLWHPFFPAFAWGSIGFDAFWPWSGGPLPAEDGPDAGWPTGGLQLDIQPWRAQVYVDGWYAGPVGDFTGYYHHLDLPAGPHRLEILAADYQPLVMDVMVSPGQTTTYRGTLAFAPHGY